MFTLIFIGMLVICEGINQALEGEWSNGNI